MNRQSRGISGKVDTGFPKENTLRIVSGSTKAGPPGASRSIEREKFRNRTARSGDFAPLLHRCNTLA
jgi:hypothetical protein